MKAFNKVLFLFFLLTVMIPFQIMAAELDYSGGLLDFKVFKTISTLNDITGPVGNTNMTDNDGATSQLMNKNTGVVFELDEIKDIGSYRLLANAHPRIGFYDDKNVRIGEYVDSTPINGVDVVVNRDNVKYIKLFVNSANPPVTVIEFNVYEKPLPLPDIPTGLTAHSDIGQINLSWNAVTGADSYNIYRDLVMIGNVTVPSYLDEDVANGIVYEYSVSAVNGNGESNRSVVVSAKPMEPPPPNVPTGLKVIPGEEKAALSWDAVTNANSYNIYKNSVFIKNTVSTSYIDSDVVNGIEYTYSITAKNDYGESGHSVSVKVVPGVVLELPSVVQDIVITSLNGGLHVSWRKNSLSEQVQGYNVYLNGVKHNADLIAQNGYYILGLDNGVEYEVQLSAVNEIGESGLSFAYISEPSTASMPVIAMDYSLGDISTGVGNWFGSLWLILAFSIAIPVSFIVGRNVKDLFA